MTPLHCLNRKVAFNLFSQMTLSSLHLRITWVIYQNYIVIFSSPVFNRVFIKTWILSQNRTNMEHVTWLNWSKSEFNEHGKVFSRFDTSMMRVAENSLHKDQNLKIWFSNYFGVLNLFSFPINVQQKGMV